ncbi:MAG TPA: hemerythrin domain-containing protein [Chthonomonadaceae bacterium]|nr:hemerythrin domain-containing protein [Chthonomonadaceae bacterium]
MPIQIGARTGHTFGEPLGLLSDCHRRIEKFLDQLLQVAEQAQGGPLTGPQREALDTALRYFHKAAPLHTADEESSLFPRMRATGDPAAAEAFAALDMLEADHRAAAADHAEVDTLGQEWLLEGCLPHAETQQLIQTLQRLKALYARHIAVEDRQVFPLAGRLLSEDTLRTVGREMAMRRGLDADTISPQPSSKRNNTGPAE